MPHDPEKSKSIAEIIEARKVQFIKMHLTRPSPGKSALNWPTRAK
jgi:hypothetical protein